MTPGAVEDALRRVGEGADEAINLAEAALLCAAHERSNGSAPAASPFARRVVARCSLQSAVCVLSSPKRAVRISSARRSSGSASARSP